MKRNKLRNLWGFQPLARAAIVVSAVAVLATGVTYAALQSQSATLTGNTIGTATADLRIGSSTTFSTTKVGFTFANIVPGATAAPEGNIFYLRNVSGTSVMNLKVAISSIPINVQNADLSKVYFVLTRVDTTSSQKFSIASLVSSFATGGLPLTDLLAGGPQGAQYRLQVMMDEDAFTGVSAGISGMDIVFTGQVLATPPVQAN